MAVTCQGDSQEVSREAFELHTQGSKEDISEINFFQSCDKPMQNANDIRRMAARGTTPFLYVNSLHRFLYSDMINENDVQRGGSVQ